VLARASDLRSRISACAAAAAARSLPRLCAGEEEDGEEEVGVESLVGINDALESLEQQLASLQVRLSFRKKGVFIVALLASLAACFCGYGKNLTSSRFVRRAGVAMII
jgi:hypothetical protein